MDMQLAITISACAVSSSAPASSTGLPGWAVATLVVLLLLLFVALAGAAVVILVLLSSQKGKNKFVTGKCSNHCMK